MARPRSEDKKNAIMAAAIRVINTQGLSASTASIAQEAGVSNGTLFVYFPTKADLLNHLYINVKTDMASAAMKGLSARDDLRGQMFQVWSNWMKWAVGNPDRKRAMALLGGSDDITPETRAAGHQIMSEIAALIEKCRINGPMRDTPMPFVGAVINSVAETTMDFMIQDKMHAEEHCKSGFEAIWRVLN